MNYNCDPGQGNYNTQKSFKIRLGKKSVVICSRVLLFFGISEKAHFTRFHLLKNRKFALLYTCSCNVRATWRHLRYYVVNVVNVYSYYLRRFPKNLRNFNSFYFKKFFSFLQTQCFTAFSENPQKNCIRGQIDKNDTIVSRIIATQGGFY